MQLLSFGWLKFVGEERFIISTIISLLAVYLESLDSIWYIARQYFGMQFPCKIAQPFSVIRSPNYNMFVHA